MYKSFTGLALVLAVACAHAASGAHASLGAYLQANYPSLDYVDRYRHSFPDDTQGDARLLGAGGASVRTHSNAELVEALVALQDAQIAFNGAGGKKSETLGVLFRSPSDGHMLVWRVFDPAVAG